MHTFPTQGVCAGHDALFDTTAAGRRRAQRSERTSQRSIVCSPFSNDRSKTAAPRRHSTGFRAEHFARRRRTVVKVGKLVNLDAFITETMHVPAATTDEELLACFARTAQPHLRHMPRVRGGGAAVRSAEGSRRRQAFVAAREAQSASRQRFSAASESILETLDADRTVDVLEAIVVNTSAAHPEA